MRNGWWSLGVSIACIMLLVSCGGRPERISEWSIAYEDLESGRIAVCDVNGSGARMLTPDSLQASLPVADSTGRYVLFVGTPWDAETGPYAIYRISSDGSELERVMPLPFRPISLAVSPGGRFMLFGAKYPDEENYRLYLHNPDVAGFKAIVPPHRAAHDPTFSQLELNFVFDLDPPSDTGWVGFVSGERPMPIYQYELRQPTFHPSGEWVVGVCDPSGGSLCKFRFRTLTDSLIMQPVEAGTVLANPAYCPDGRMVCYEFTTPVDSDGPQLGIWEDNANDNNELYSIASGARWPAWIR